MTRAIKVMKLGKTRYLIGLKLQNHILNLIKKNIDSCSNVLQNGVLILTEHDPVYTVGIRSKDYDASYGQILRNLGADYYETNRGGLITFHGPGQLVAYPILNLKQFKPSVRWYISKLEDAVISACCRFNLDAYRSPHTGVWVNDKKICAMGIHVSKHVTSHGLALNCNTDLKWFQHIVPCGIEGKGVTSLSVECRKNIAIDDATDIFIECFLNQFGCEAESVPSDTVLEILEKCVSS